jgi:phosphoribosylanthranilate isomerase
VLRTRVKICGITRAADAEVAASAGADAIGLVFATGSARRVDLQRACEIAAAVGPLVSLVGVFVDHAADEVRRVFDAVPLHLAQLHGDESPEYCAVLDRPYLKALRMRPELDVAGLARRFPGARGLLLDAWHPRRAGGTGETFEWQRARGIAGPVIMAGGLTPGNVATVISLVRPWAVDVSSGVEQEAGVKDRGKILAFLAAVRAADAEQ